LTFAKISHFIDVFYKMIGEFRLKIQPNFLFL